MMTSEFWLYGPVCVCVCVFMRAMCMISNDALVSMLVEHFVCSYGVKKVCV